jgi:hypothetical protein
MNMGTTVHPRARHELPAEVRAADYRAGLLAGLAAGVAMSFVMMALTTFMMNMGPWAAPKMAWSLVAGKEAIRPGFETVPVMAGMIVHLGLSALFGLVFAWLGSIVPLGDVALGIVYGFGLYVTNIVVVPQLLPGWAGHMYPPNGMMHVMSALEHAFFGLVLGWAYHAWRRR